MLGPKKIKFLVCLMLLPLTGLLFQNCSTEIINPTATPVGLNFAPYNASASAKITTKSVSNLTICIRYIRFRGVTDDETVEVPFGELAVNPAGTPIADIDVPNGSYTSIEIELKKEYCASELSVVVTNDNGTFSTDEDVKMSFDGGILIENDEIELDLFIQTIVSALQSVSSGEQIRDSVQSVTGSF